MRFAVVGVSCKNTEMNIREQLVFSDTKKMEMYVDLMSHDIKESVILSTCNRSEIYFLYEEESQIELVKERFVAFFEQVTFSEYLFSYHDLEAITYLFEVTNGLHSLVLGEDQILGQIVKAEEFARENGSSKKIMNRIFRDAITCAKKAKTQYKISEHPLSLSYVGIQELKKSCGLKDKTVLVLGSGKMATLALTYLFEEGVRKVYNANRSIENAKILQKQFSNLEIIPFKARYQYILECDILITATASPHAIIRKDELPKLYKDLYVLDIATPRDVEPSLKENKKIHLYDLDELQKRVQSNTKERESKVEQIKALIKEESKICEHWIVSTRVDTTIKTLQERINEVSNEAYTLLEKKLTLSEHDKFVLKKTLYTSMQRLMHNPIMTLKEVEEEKQETYEEIVKELFHLENKEN